MSDGESIIYYTGESMFNDRINEVYNNQTVLNFYFELEQKIRTNITNAPILTESRMMILQDLLRSFQYFLFAAHRFGISVISTYEYSDYTFGNKRPHHEYRNLNGGNVEYRFAPSEIYFDFQSLILESSAILDKLTVGLIEYNDKYIMERTNSTDRKYVTNRFKALYNGSNNEKVDQECGKVLKRVLPIYEEKGYFSNFEKRLRDSSSLESVKILEAFEECKHFFDGVLINLASGKTNLRNEFAHNRNILSLNSDLFCVYITTQGKLYLDHIIDDLPIIQTAQKLINSTSYLFIKTMAILFQHIEFKSFFKLTRTIELNDFKTVWQNHYVDYRPYLNNGDTRISLHTTERTKEHFIENFQEFNDEILKHSI
ncbi:hypothetical protein CRV01_07525 [Arcobacter sp. CECT 8983]|uniref:hypothetical protein n=1 Tax=Arcobacter sp. CECT 8983 TaxID=2044508 RepID=UPI00100AF697|nr:hypothetical protein [Arcobacter sp. CECT 8983]RXJ89715.1 hypothetical protein CRV01_07525 [Arcobacter sp. CECT 8983]